MTKFNRDQFEYSGGYLTYKMEPTHYASRGRFVARFKRTGRDKPGFVSFLIKNFTVEEYFDRYEAGEAPATILESKGYVSATIKRMLKDRGYPMTVEGFRQMIAAEAAAYR